MGERPAPCLVGDEGDGLAFGQPGSGRQVGRRPGDLPDRVVELDGLAGRELAGDEGCAETALEVGVDEDVGDLHLARVQDRAGDLVGSLREVRAQLQPAVAGGCRAHDADAAVDDSVLGDGRARAAEDVLLGARALGGGGQRAADAGGCLVGVGDRIGREQAVGAEGEAVVAAGREYDPVHGDPRQNPVRADPVELDLGVPDTCLQALADPIADQREGERDHRCGDPEQSRFSDPAQELVVERHDQEQVEAEQGPHEPEGREGGVGGLWEQDPRQLAGIEEGPPRRLALAGDRLQAAGECLGPGDGGQPHARQAGARGRRVRVEEKLHHQPGAVAGLDLQRASGNRIEDRPGALGQAALRDLRGELGLEPAQLGHRRQRFEHRVTGRREGDQLGRKPALAPGQVAGARDQQLPAQPYEVAQRLQLVPRQTGAVIAIDQHRRVAGQVGGAVRERVRLVPLRDAHGQLPDPDRLQLRSQRAGLGQHPDGHRLAVVDRHVGHRQAAGVLHQHLDEVVGCEEAVGPLVSRAECDGELVGRIGRRLLRGRPER